MTQLSHDAVGVDLAAALFPVGSRVVYGPEIGVVVDVRENNYRDPSEYYIVGGAFVRKHFPTTLKHGPYVAFRRDSDGRITDRAPDRLELVEPSDVTREVVTERFEVIRTIVVETRLIPQ